MLPLLESALPTLLPLAKKWQTWAILGLSALVVYVLLLRQQLATANLELAARPRVETKVQTQTRTIIAAGPVRTETKIIYRPGTKEIQYVDRIVTQDPVTTTTVAEKAYDQTVAPACPAAPKAHWRSVSALVDPFAATKLVGLHGGITLGDRVDLGFEARTQPNAVAFDAGIRF